MNIDTNFIKHNRHFMSTYFLPDPFEFLYYFYRIRGELIYVLSIVVCIPSTRGFFVSRGSEVIIIVFRCSH